MVLLCKPQYALLPYLGLGGGDASVGRAEVFQVMCSVVDTNAGFRFGTHTTFCLSIDLLCKSSQIVGYRDEINIMSRSLESAKKETNEIGLGINETKC